MCVGLQPFTCRATVLQCSDLSPNTPKTANQGDQGYLKITDRSVAAGLLNWYLQDSCSPGTRLETTGVGQANLDDIGVGHNTECDYTSKRQPKDSQLIRLYQWMILQDLVCFLQETCTHKHTSVKINQLFTTQPNLGLYILKYSGFCFLGEGWRFVRPLR